MRNTAFRKTTRFAEGKFLNANLVAFFHVFRFVVDARPRSVVFFYGCWLPVPNLPKCLRMQIAELLYDTARHYTALHDPCSHASESNK